MTNTKPFHYVSLVCREQDTIQYLLGAVPSLLAPGNLAAVQHGIHDVYTLYTTEEFFDVIKHSAEFAKLASIVPMQVRLCNPSSLESHTAKDIPTHTAAEAVSALAFEEARQHSAVVVHLKPNRIWSQGSLGAIRELFAQGKGVVATPRLEVKHGVLQALHNCFTHGSILEIAAPPRALMAIVMEHLNGFSCRQESNTPLFMKCNPWRLLWNVRREGIIALEPGWDTTAVLSTIAPPTFSWSGPSWIANALKVGVSADDLYCIRDSDQALVVELTSDTNSAGDWQLELGTPEGTCSMLHLAAWIHTCIPQKARMCIEEPVRYRAMEPSPRWHEIENAALNYVHELVEFLSQLDDDGGLAHDLQQHTHMVNTLQREEQAWQDIARKMLETLTSNATCHETLAELARLQINKEP